MSISQQVATPSRDRAGRGNEGTTGVAGSENEADSASRIVALDGLRAIAILWVIAHNVGSPDDGASSIALKLWVIVSNSGWIGVQLFFALSGFLITRILLDNREVPGAIGRFYARRLLRIVPLYFTLLAVVFFVVPHIDALSAMRTPGTRSSLWFWAYLSNWVAPFGGLPAPLPHVWSLAVEEQFYLFWPLVVGFASKRMLPRIAWAMVVGSLIVRVILHLTLPGEPGSSAAYQFTIARCDAIALGALAAIAMRSSDATRLIRRHLHQVAIACLVLVVGILLVNRGMGARGWFTEIVNQPLTAIGSTVLVLLCVAPIDARAAVSSMQRRIVRWMSASWLTTIGKYSYAIYIFHSPVHRVVRPYLAEWLKTGSGNFRFLSHIGFCLLVLAISLALALVTWNLIEQPFLALKRYFPMSGARNAGVGADVTDTARPPQESYAR